MRYESVVLFCYDGSADARRAFAAAGAFMAGRAVVVHAGVAPAPLAAAPGVPLPAPDPANGDALSDQERERGERLAAEGADVARKAGWDADPEFLPVPAVSDIAGALCATADERAAAVIVAGRGRAGTVKGAVLGSVAGGLVRQSRRPVLIVPTAD